MGHLTTLWVLWLSLCPLSFLGTQGAHRGKSHRHSTLCGGAVTLFLSNKGAWKAGERAGFEATHSAHPRTLLEDLAEIPLPPLFCFILFHLSISSFQEPSVAWMRSYPPLNCLVGALWRMVELILKHGS